MDYHSHSFQIYYEDTDLSGIVYHANYLKYFERAREHLLGVNELVRLYYDDGIGFVVYKVELTFKEGARLGDALEIRTKAYAQSEYRAIFEQSVWRPDGSQALVEGIVQLVCVNKDNKLMPLPAKVIERLPSS
jgi:acyl-CoA thioester hydrolase